MGDDLIKQGYNIYSYYWTIIALFVFLSINFFSRNFKVEALNIQMMVSIVSFLFGFFISITFTMLFSRVIALKDHLAGETGRLVNLFHLSKFLGDEFHKKVINRIDNYTIKTLKYYTNYEAGREEIYGLYDDLRSIPKESRAQNSIYIGSFLSNLADLEEIREKLEYLTSKRAEWSLKFADLILGSLLIVFFF
jgi:hypothetical protein